MYRCVKADFGFSGCYSDVTKLMDRKCSGRQQCSVRVDDPTFGNIQPCNKEFKNYLEASYECLSGMIKFQNNPSPVLQDARNFLHELDWRSIESDCRSEKKL